MTQGRLIPATRFLYYSAITDMGRINAIAWVISSITASPPLWVLILISVIYLIVFFIPLFYRRMQELKLQKHISGSFSGDTAILSISLILVNQYAITFFQTSLQQGFLITSIIFIIIGMSSVINSKYLSLLLGIISTAVAFYASVKLWPNNYIITICYTIYMLLALGGIYGNVSMLAKGSYFKHYSEESRSRLGIMFYFFEVFTLLLGGFLNNSFLSSLLSRSKDMVDAQYEERNRVMSYLEEKPETAEIINHESVKEEPSRVVFHLSSEEDTWEREELDPKYTQFETDKKL